jgi:hypothetical protein
MEGLKDLRVPLRLPSLMRDAGFVDVEHRMIQLPTCGWSTGKLSSNSTYYALSLVTSHYVTVRSQTKTIIQILNADG